MATNQCWLCEQNNPSYRDECEFCKGALTPTYNGDGFMEWTVFTFISDVAMPGTSFFSQFPQAMEVLNMQDRVVIRLGDDQQGKRFILVRYEQGRTQYSYQCSEDRETEDWARATHEQRELLFGFVRDHVDNARGFAGMTYIAN